MWVRGAVMAVAGFSSMVLVSSISLAQYPGSAGDLNSGAVGASSSASVGASSASGGLSSSVSNDVAGDSAVSGSMASSGSSAGSSDGGDGYGGGTVAVLPPKKAGRKRALIRQFRLEFAKILTIETANKRPLHALSADLYLDQFSKEMDDGLDWQADISSLGRDLVLVRDSLDDRLDDVIASYGGEALRRDFFAKTTSAAGLAPALRTEIQKLKLKHELLAFGEFSLQAMGYYAK